MIIAKKMKRLRKRGVDGDAKFIFMLSVLSGVLTLGITHLYIFYRVRKRAATCLTTHRSISAIAILGHQLENGNISEDYQSRLDRAVALYRDSDKPVIKILGGCPQLGISEARAGHQHLMQQGIPDKDLSMEEMSTNTLQNMPHSRNWFSLHDEVILVTNRYHLERLQTLADGIGLMIQPCATEKI